jgi:acetate kinase
LILVINCGSSSAKYQLYDRKTFRSLAKGVIEKIGVSGACPDHYAAIESIVAALTGRRSGAIKTARDIRGIGHRVVHGGEEFRHSTIITDRVVRSIEKYAKLAPLHNPPSLAGIKACSKILKGIPQVAVFDTSFHQTMPARAYLYGIPFEYYAKYGIRRYGFHGTSHAFVAGEAAKKLGRPLRRLCIVTCHLGNGCSMAAVEGGRSVDTTMGLTPLEGLLMGTRSGDLDPAVVLHLLEREGLSVRRLGEVLNKESGLLGISGISNDMRDLLRRSASSKRARLAIDIFVYRIEKYIGAYQAAMGRLDAVVFTGGIGENNPWLVKRIATDLKRVVPEGTKFMVVPTNEELLIAKDTWEIVKNRN